MNKTYRSIWNESLGAWVAVSEIETAKGKPASGSLVQKKGNRAVVFPLKVVLLPLMAALGFMLPMSAYGVDGPVCLWEGVGSQGGAPGSGAHSIRCGYQSAANLDQSIAIGPLSKATGLQSIAVGGDVIASGSNSIAIGGDDLTKVAGADNTSNIAIKYRDLTGDQLYKGYKGTTSGSGGVAIGTSAVAGDLATAFGTRAVSSGVASLALGVGSTADKENAVAIGAGSTTATDATAPQSVTIGGVTFNFNGGANLQAGDQVSFGSAGFERQLKNVAPGVVSSSSTDAVNGSQLYSIADELVRVRGNVNTLQSEKTHFYSVRSTDSAAANYNNDGATGNDAVAAGVAATAAGNAAVAIGKSTKAAAAGSIAVGETAVVNTTGDSTGAIAVGLNSVSDGKAAVAIGNEAGASKNHTVAVGVRAKSTAEGAVTVGQNTAASGTNSAAVGSNAIASGGASVAFGQASKAQAQSATAIGDGAVVTAGQGTAIGVSARVNNNGAGGVAMGMSSTVDAYHGTALGISSKVLGTGSQYAVAVGSEAASSGNSAIAVGRKAQAKAHSSIAVGINTIAGTSNTVAIGQNTRSLSDNAVAMGNKAYAAKTGSIVLGTNAGQIEGIMNDLKAESTRTPEESAALTAAQTKATKVGADVIYIGADSGREAVSNEQQISIGKGAGWGVEGSHNIGMGSQAGAYVKGTNNIAIGTKANGELPVNNAAPSITNVSDTVAIGTGTKAGKSNAVAVGKGAQALGEKSISVGTENVVTGNNTYVMGSSNGTAAAPINAIDTSIIGTSNSISIANSAQVTAGNIHIQGSRNTVGRIHSSVLGSDNKVGLTDTTGTQGMIAIGQRNEVDADGAIAIGLSNIAKGRSSIAMGANAKVGADGSSAVDGIAIGNSAQAVADNATVLGSYTKAGSWSTALGTRAYATNNQALAVGMSAYSREQRGVSLGARAYSGANAGVALGYQSMVADTAISSVAIGTGSVVSGRYSGVWNSTIAKNADQFNRSTDYSFVGGENSYAIGNKNIIGNQSSDTFIFGNNVKLGATGATLVSTNHTGQGNDISSRRETVEYTGAQNITGMVALGSDTAVTVSDGVALGKGSKATTDKGQVGADPLNAAADKTGAAWKATKAAVAVGADTTESRQITGVAAGTQDADAVNVAQLKAAGFKLLASKSEGEVFGEAETKIKNGETVTVDAGKNIKLTQAAGKITVATKDDVSFSSVTIPAATPAAAGKTAVVLNSDGLNNGGNKITNVAAGEIASGSTEAVTGGQLYEVKNGGWNLKGNSAQTDLVKQNDSVDFVSGTGTTAEVATDGTASTVKFSVNKSGLNVAADGTVTAATAGDNFATATDVATAINSAGKTTVVAQGKNVTVSTQTSGKTTTYTVDAEKTTVSSEADSGVKVTAGAKDADGVTNYALDLSDTAKADVAKGVAAKNAVDSQGLTFNADGNTTTGVKKLGDSVAVKGDTNITTAATSEGIQIKLNPALNVTSVTVGDSKLVSDGLTISGGAAGNPVRLTKTGLDNGDNKITNVGKGNIAAGSKDAVTGDQLYEVKNSGWNLQGNGTQSDVVKQSDSVNFANGTGTTAEVTTIGETASTVKFSVNKSALSVDGDGTVTAATAGDNFATAEEVATAINSAGKTTVVSAGDNVTVNTQTNGKTTTYTVNAEKTTVSSATGGSVKVTAGTKGANGVTDYALDLTEAAKADVAKGVAAKGAVDGWGLTFVAGDNTETGVKKLGDRVTVKGDNNISTTAASDYIQVTLNPELNVTSVTAGDSKLVSDGLTINNGAAGSPVTLTKSGLDNGGNKITNVASAGDITDTANAKNAVNAGDLNTVKQAADSKLGSFTVGTDSAATAAGIGVDKDHPRFDVVGKDGIATAVNGREIEVKLNDASKASLVKADSALQTITSDNPNLTVGGKDSNGNIQLGFSNNPTFTGGITAGAANGNPLSINTDGSGTISGLSNKTVTDPTFGKSGRAATEEQLAAIRDIAQNGRDQGLNFAGNSGNFKRQLGETVTVKGGLADSATASNTNVRTVANSDGSIDIQLADAPTFTGKLTAHGLDANSQKITNVQNATDDKDAVNLEQLRKAMKDVEVENLSKVEANSPFSYVNSAGEQLIRKVDDTTKQVSFVKASDGKTAYAGNDITISALNAVDPQVTTPTLIGNLAAGQKDNDAVNVAQLKESLKALGGGAGVDSTGNVTQPSFAVKNADGTTKATVNTVAAALTNLNDVVSAPITVSGNTNNGTSTIVAKGSDQKLGSKLAIKGGMADSVAADKASAKNIRTVVTDNNVEIQIAESPQFGNIVVNDNGKITGVEAGTVESNGKDAVNGGQLFAQGEGVKNIIGGNTTYNPTDGSFTNADIGGTGKSNVDEAIREVKNSLDAGWTLTAEGQNGKKVAAGETVDLYNDDNNIVISKADSDNRVKFELAKALTAESITTGDSKLDSDGLTINNGPSVTKNGIDAGNKKISRVAAGNIAKDSSEAVNGGQLYNTADSIKTVLGGNAEVTPDGKVTVSDLGGTGKNTVQEALEHVNKGWKAKVAKSDGEAEPLAQEDAIQPDETLTFDAGKNIKLTQTAGKISIATKDVVDFKTVTAGQGANQVVLGDEGVKVGGNTYISNNGLNANDKVITNVAAGKNSEDAANVSQLTPLAKALNMAFEPNTGEVAAPAYNVSTADGNTTTADTVQDALNNIGTELQKGLNITADNSKLTNGKAADKVNLGGTVLYTSTDKNIVTTVLDGNKIDFGLAKTITVGDKADAAAKPITIDGTKGSISGLGDNLTNVAADDKAVAKPADIKGSNAATVNDVLNAGWNLQANGEAKDVVTPYDTVNFVDGTGTTVSIESNGGVSTVKVNVDAQNLAEAAQLPVVYTDAAGNKVYKQQDGTFNKDPNGTGDKVEKADVIASLQNADGSTTDAAKLANIADGKVADGSKEAVNGSQLFNTADSIKNVLGGNAEVTPEGKVTASNLGGTGKGTVHEALAHVNKGWKAQVTQGDGEAVPFGQEDAIQPDETLTFDAGKNIKLTHTEGKISIATKDEVKFTSVTAGQGDNQVVLDSDGVKVGGNTYISNSGLNANDKVISNVAKGEKDTDAVNVKQMNDQLAATEKTTTVVAGKNVTVSSKVDGNNTEYTVNAEKTTVSSATGGSVKVTAGNKDADGVTDYALDLTDAAKADVAKGVAAKEAVDTQGLTFTADDNSTTGVKKLGSSVAVNGDDNITTTADADGVKLALKKDLNVTSVTAGDSKLVSDGLTINNGTAGKPVKLTKDGLDNGGNRITKVAKGVDAEDAVNKAQLEEVAAAATSKVEAGNDNIVVTPEKAADGSTTYKVATAKDLKADSLTAGNTVVNNDGVKVGNDVALTSDGLKAGDVKVGKGGIDAGNKAIANVAAGKVAKDSKEAVNGGQLFAQGEGVKNIIGGNTVYDPATGSYTNADIGGTGQSNIHDAISSVNTAAKAAKTEVKAGDNITVTEAKGNNGQTVYTVATAKEVAFDKVGIGNIKADGSSNTIGGLANTALGGNDFAKGGRVATEEQLNAAQGNLADIIGGNAVNNGGAVNVSNIGGTGKNTVHEAVAAAKTTVVEGKNIKVTESKNADGSTRYEVATQDNAVFNSVTAGDTVVNGSGVKVGNDVALTSDGFKAGDVAVNKGGINAGGKAIANVAAGKLAADSKEAVNGSQLHATNQAVTALNNGAAGVVQYSNADAPTTPNGGTKSNDVTLVGADANAPVVIHNVGAGSAPTDAVNVGQLANVGNQLNQRIENVGRDANAGTASAMAVAGLPQAYLPGKSMMAVAGSTYRGEQGYAVGFSSISDNGNWIIKGTAGGNTRGHFGATAGVGYQW